MMYNLDNTYKEWVFRQKRSLHWRANLVCKPINILFEPKSIVDLGCGSGDLLKYFYSELKKTDIIGIEGTTNCLNQLWIPRDKVWIRDLRKIWRVQNTTVLDPLYSFKKDIALCLEVAEHLEEGFVNNFMYNVTAFSDRIIFSAAPPGQGGRQHVNCQYKEYWEKKFLEKDYIRRPCLEHALKTTWMKWSNTKGIKAYYQNLMVFIKIGICPKC